MNWRRLWIVFAISFGIRAIYLLGVGMDPRYAVTPDSTGYLQAAHNLSAYGVFSLSDQPPLVPDTVRTPAYPVFLLLFSSDSYPQIPLVLWAQALLGAATAGLLYALGLLCWRDSASNAPGERAALVASIGWSLDPATVMHTGLVLTESLFIFVFVVSFFFLTRAFLSGCGRGSWRWLILSGLGLGLTALVRPVGLYYFIFAAAALTWGWREVVLHGAVSMRLLARRGWRRELPNQMIGALAIFLIASVLLPALWIARNRAATGIATFSSIQGLNIFQIRSAAVQAELNHVSYDEALVQVQEELKAAHPEPFASKAQEAAYAGRWAGWFLLSHPSAYAKVMLKDVVKMFGGHGMEIAAWALLKDDYYDPMHPPSSGGGFSGTRGLVRHHPSLSIAIFGYIIFLGVVYCLAAMGFITIWRGNAPIAVLCASPILYLTFLNIGALAYYRFRLPMMPFIFLLAGFYSPISRR